MKKSYMHVTPAVLTVQVLAGPAKQLTFTLQLLEFSTTPPSLIPANPNFRPSSSLLRCLLLALCFAAASSACLGRCAARLWLSRQEVQQLVHAEWLPAASACCCCRRRLHCQGLHQLDVAHQWVRLRQRPSPEPLKGGPSLCQQLSAQLLRAASTALAAEGKRAPPCWVRQSGYADAPSSFICVPCVPLACRGETRRTCPCAVSTAATSGTTTCLEQQAATHYTHVCTTSS